jgi:hypothetical protein
MNWEVQYEDWKVDRWIEKSKMNIEKLIDELRRKISQLKSGIINWEREYEHWKVDWWIEKSKISIEKLIDELWRGIWTLKS